MPDKTTHDPDRVAIIGAGPAGLMAAEALTQRGIGVDIYEAMPSAGRKLLMAGKSGLNITHTEDEQVFLARYGDDARIADLVRLFGPMQIISWMQGLGIPAHIGSTGRVFPQMMKASPLLRKWLARLQEAGAVIHPRHYWLGWDDDGGLKFDAPKGALRVMPRATVLALGGGSWRRLGSDGAWADLLRAKNIPVIPFAPSNGGFTIDWSDRMRAEFAGAPVKSVRLSAGAAASRAEFVITQTGVESGGIYMLSASLREALEATGQATLLVDLLPDMSGPKLMERLRRPRGKQSLTNHLRKTIRLTGVKLALLYEIADRDILSNAESLAKLIKALPLKVTGTAPLDQAISTAGGVPWSALTPQLMLIQRPGVFCAGEMIDWDAPTGGYLLTACFATGRAAGRGAADFVAGKA
ncbi:MAG: TIGR03862 family flavoprotein [Parvularculaceae bacterium]